MKVALLSEISDPAPFLSDNDFCAQEKLNGVRMLVEKRKYEVDAFNRRGERSEIPDAVEAVALTSDMDWIIDGEFVGGEFVAFDVLSINGADITPLPMDARFSTLCSVSPFRLVRDTRTEEDKNELLSSVYEENGEGVVFKRISAPYADGRDDSGVKFKFWKSASFIVRDIDIAKGTAGLSIGPQDFGRVRFPHNSIWPKVGQIVEVRFMLVTKNGKLSQPSFLGIRSDLVEADVIAQKVG